MHSAGHRIRKLHGDGSVATVTTVAGSGIRGFRDGTASEAEFNHPYDVAPWGGLTSGDLLIADALNHRIRMYSAGWSTFYAHQQHCSNSCAKKHLNRGWGGQNLASSPLRLAPAVGASPTISVQLKQN